MLHFNNFSEAIENALSKFTPKTVQTHTWQGVDTLKKPEMAMHETLFYGFQSLLPSTNLEYYQRDIKPNLPWADNHFLERVSGHPLNPGKEWANWPWGKSADTFRGSNGQFNHSYMERMWPRYAKKTIDGVIPSNVGFGAHEGIRGEYGDLNSVISLLAKDPFTRQAYLPIFFPEDTGDTNPGRKPCTIGYHFLHRDDYLHITYYIRSCDFYRHFRDDLYLTVRLLLWVLDRLKEKDLYWEKVWPGQFVFLCGSMHMFVNDFQVLKKMRKNG